MLLLGRSIVCRVCSARVDLTTAATLQATGLGVTIDCAHCGCIWTYRASRHETDEPVDASDAPPESVAS